MSLRNVLLALLSKRPNSGYGLGRLLRRDVNHLWDARLQQIYGELARLHEDGLVHVERHDLPNRPAKKVYSLTREGEETLDAWLRAPCTLQINKDDLLVRLYCLERMPNNVLVRRLQERRDEYQMAVKELQDRLQQVPRTDPAEAGLLLTLEAAFAAAEAQVDWCERAIAWLREVEDTAASVRHDVRAASA